MKLAKVRGTRDLLASSALSISRVLQTGQAVLSSAGYKTVYLPTLEHEELFNHSLGAGSDIVMKEMFQVADPSGNKIVLRPEGTVGCMRAYLQSTPGDPVKWLYSGSMFRRERPQHGRYREFMQLGAEAIGLPSLPFVDVELIALGAEVLTKLGVQTELHLNTLGLSPERSVYTDHLKQYFEQHKERLSPTSRDRLLRNPMRILDSKEPEDRQLLQNAPRLVEFLSPASQQFFADVKAALTQLHIPFVEDPWLVRGLDYYCHTCFEFLNDGRAVLAGGRYTGLSRLLGAEKEYTGTGWAAGVDRIAELAGEVKEGGGTVGVVAVGKEQDAMCQALVARLRVELPPACSVLFSSGVLPVTQALKLMHRLKARKVVLIGEEEVKAGKCKVKDMMEGKQEVVEIGDFQEVKRAVSTVASPPIT